MKSVLLISIVFLFGTASQASMSAQYQSQHVQFTLDTILPGATSGNVYYSCDGAQSAARDILKTLGATNIKVGCTSSNPDEPSVFTTLDMRYSSLMPLAAGNVQADVRAIKIRGDSGCYLAQQIVDRVKKTFTISNIVNNSYCETDDQPYIITADVLRE